VVVRRCLILCGLAACVSTSSCSSSSSHHGYCGNSFLWHHSPYYSARTFPVQSGERVDSVSPLPRGHLLGSAPMLTCKGSITIYQIVGIDPEIAVASKDGTVFVGKRARVPSALVASPTR
jgi:hypothetical protein